MCECVNIKMGSYDNQIDVKMPNGELMGIDKCIAEEVQYLWTLGITTTGCCCGHNVAEGYIGVIDKDIEIMKKGGYRVHYNKCRPNDEDSFIPKSHYDDGKLNYLDYPNLYKKEGDYNKVNKIYLGDCLIEHTKIKSGSVDLILTDLPYGTMNGFNGINWDFAIEPKKVYEIANRLLRPNGKMILFSQEPYTSDLINKSIRNIPFSYRAIWEKDNFANALKCNGAMVGFFEDILMYSKRYDADIELLHPLRLYFKNVIDFIGLNLKQINTKLGHRKAEHTFYINSTQYELCTEQVYNELINELDIDIWNGFKTYNELKEIDDQFKKDFPSTFNLWEGKKYKSNILKYKKNYDGYHPTQKPVLLLEDLIKTFSNEGDLVVDLTAGSGSTGVACVNTNRKYILIEKDKEYTEIAQKRIKAIPQTLFDYTK